MEENTEKMINVEEPDKVNVTDCAPEEYPDDLVLDTDFRRFRYVLTTSRNIPVDGGGVTTVYDIGGNQEGSWQSILHILRDVQSRPNTKATGGIMPCWVTEGESRSGKSRGQVGRYRQAHLCTDLSMLILDIEDADWGTDDGDVIAHQVQDAVGGACTAVYSSYNHGNPDKWQPSYPRFRVVLPLSRDVTHAEHHALWVWCTSIFVGVDKAAKDAARVFYLPVPGPENKKERKTPSWIIDLHGHLLDPDALPDGGSVAELVSAIEAERTKNRSELDTTLRTKGLGPEDIHVMLQHIDGDGTYDQWLRVGFALWHTANVARTITDDVAYQAWADWSVLDPIKTRHHKVDRDKWDALGADGRDNPVTLGTLIWMAQQGGWVLPRSWTAGSRLLAGTGDKDLADRIIDQMTWRQDAYDVIRYAMDRTETGHLMVTGQLRATPKDLGDRPEAYLRYDHPYLMWPSQEDGVWRELTKEQIKTHMAGWNRQLMVAGKPKADGTHGDPTPYVYSDQSGNAVYATLMAQAVADGDPTFTQMTSRQVRVKNGTLSVSPDSRLFFVAGASPLGFALTQTIPTDWVADAVISPCQGDPFDLTAIDRLDYRWRMWMQRWFGDDGTAELVLEYLGACLFGEGYLQQGAVVLLGAGGQGKSVFLDLIQRFFGSARSGLAPHDMDDPQRFALLQLVGSRINVYADMSDKALINSARFKAVVGGDWITANVKHIAQEVHFKPICGHVYSCNSLPAVNDHSDGFRDRWYPIQWADTTNYRDNPNLKITELDRKIFDQLGPAILRSLIDGYVRFVRRGKKMGPVSPNIRALREQWRGDQDGVWSFVQDRRGDDQDTWSGATALYQVYREQTIRDGGQPVKRGTFTKRLREMGLEPTRTKAGWQYPLRMFGGDEITSSDDDFVGFN